MQSRHLSVRKRTIKKAQALIRLTHTQASEAKEFYEFGLYELEKYLVNDKPHYSIVSEAYI